MIAFVSRRTASPAWTYSVFAHVPHRLRPALALALLVAPTLLLARRAAPAGQGITVGPNVQASMTPSTIPQASGAGIVVGP